MSTPIWSLDQSDEIVAQLRWNEVDGGAQGQAVERRLLETFNDTMTTVFRRDGLGGGPVLNLPGVARERVICHPYIAGFLFGRIELSAREVLRYVSDSLRALCGAMSDVNGPAARPSTRFRFTDPSQVGSSNMILDYENIIGVPTLEDGREWLSNYEEAPFRAILVEMDAALCNMAKVNGFAWQFVNRYIWYLSIRQNVDKPGRFGTYTFPTLPGFVLVCNPNSNSVDQFLLEETFLHEAIHCFVDWAEAIGPQILRANVPNTAFVKSPWTGNPLNLHTAFHATLVWFGLGEYFKHCIKRGLSEAHTSRFSRRVQVIENGFESKDFESLIDALGTACNPGPANVLLSLSKRRLA